MSDPKSAPTLDDVAQAAGVSTATVSRCLNFPERVAEKTRTRVLDAVQTLGYTPNFGARVMAAKRTYTIGAIIPTMENAIFARGLQAFQEELRTRGYTLLVSSSAYRPDVEEEQIRSLVARGADGLLLIGHARDPMIYDYLDRQSVPTLVAWTYAQDAILPSVGFDNHAAMRAITRQALALGHWQVGVISGITTGNDRASQRIQGIRDAMAEHGLDPATLNIIETQYDIDCGSQAFAQLMASPAPPTVVICGNDVIAVGALKQAQRMGISVPDHVSITGFDDMELARIVEPQLTTVHVPHQEMGTQAARALVEMVETEGTVTSIELPTHVTSRASLGPAIR